MALKDYEGLWTVADQPREHLISDAELRGRPRKKGPTKAQERRKNKRKRSKKKEFYKRYPHLKPKSPTPDEETKKMLEEKTVQNYYLRDGKEKALRKVQRRKDPYWMGHIMVHNEVKFFKWKYTARKLGKKPRTFETYVKRRIIPKCMYILGARQWRYYSQYQYKLLRYGFSKVKLGNRGWSLTDLAQYLFENWVTYEDPESIFGERGQNNSGGNNGRH